MRRRAPVLTGIALAQDLATALGEQGPHRITQTGRPRVLVTRALGQADDLIRALDLAGLDPIHVPAISIEIAPPGGQLDAVVARISRYGWVVVSSANGVRAVVAGGRAEAASLGSPRWAAVGNTTRRHLERSGIAVAFQPSRSDVTTMAAELPVVSGDRVPLVQGDLAAADTAATLRRRGSRSGRGHRVPDE